MPASVVQVAPADTEPPASALEVDIGASTHAGDVGCRVLYVCASEASVKVKAVAGGPPPAPPSAPRPGVHASVGHRTAPPCVPACWQFTPPAAQPETSSGGALAIGDGDEGGTSAFTARNGLVQSGSAPRAAAAAPGESRQPWQQRTGAASRRRSCPRASASGSRPRARGGRREGAALRAARAAAARYAQGKAEGVSGLPMGLQGGAAWLRTSATCRQRQQAAPQRPWRRPANAATAAAPLTPPRDATAA